MVDEDLVWRRGPRLPGHDYKIFTTGFVDATHPQTGEARRFSLIEAPDWVNIIALTTDDQVVVLRQYRPGTDRVCIEIPGGMIDPGEEPQVAAARELVEETGYTATTWRLLGTSAPNPAIQNNTLHTYLALDAALTEPPRPDAGEVLAVSTMPLPVVQQLLRTGHIDHALVIAAFGHFAFSQMELVRPPR